MWLLWDLFGIGLEEKLSEEEENVGENPEKAIVVSQVRDVSLNQGSDYGNWEGSRC